MSLTQSHWAVNAYLLVFAACIAGAGKLGDLIGLKTVYLVGVVIFGLGSAVSALAASSDALIAARALQGFGAAAIYPASLAISSLIFPPEREGQALGIFSGIAAAFLVFGPLAGGLLTQGLSWRWIFWINIPFVVIAVPAVLLCRFETKRHDAAPRLDFLGLALMIVGLGALIIGIMQGPVWGWPSVQTLVALAVGVVGLIVFTIVELRTKQPLIRVSLFRQGDFAFANGTVFIGMFQRMVLAVFGALFLQNELGMDPIDAGLALLPAMVPVAAFATYAGRLADKRDPVMLTKVGLLITGLSLVWSAIGIAMSSYWILLPSLVIWGASMALIMAPPRKTIMALAGRNQRGEASGISLAAQLLGATIGVAVASAVLSATNSYWIVFAVTAAVSFLVLLFGLLAAGKEG